MRVSRLFSVACLNNYAFPGSCLTYIAAKMGVAEHLYELQGKCDDDNASQEGPFLHKLHDMMLTGYTTEGILGVLPIRQIQH